MTKIHFHTDCPFFAGCENMLSVLFNNQKFNEKFEFSFSYNFSKEYDEGIQKRIHGIIRKYPLKLSKASSGEGNLALRFFLKFAKPILFLIDVYRIYKIIKKENPEIIHINNGGYPGALSCSAAVLSAKLAGKKKIVYVVNNIAFPLTSSFQRFLLYPVDLLVARNVTKFITASKRAGASLETVLNLNKNRLIQIPNTVLLRKPSLQSNDFRKKYGIGEKDILIGCVGLFVKRKGHIYLLKAFSEFLKKHHGPDNVFLMFDGEGELKEEIKEMVTTLKLDNNVIFTTLPNIYDLYEAMDFLVLPSIEKEDFPNVVIESMYMGKAVIGTDVGGIPEQIINGHNGFVVTPRDVNELSNAMLKLTNDKKYLIKLGENGKKLFEEKFSENVIVEKYMKLYQEILEQG